MNLENPFDQGYYTSEQLRKMEFKYVGENVQIAKNCTIIGLENISLGDNIRIDGDVTLACASGYLKIGSYILVVGVISRVLGVSSFQILVVYHKGFESILVQTITLVTR